MSTARLILFAGGCSQDKAISCRWRCLAASLRPWRSQPLTSIRLPWTSAEAQQRSPPRSCVNLGNAGSGQDQSDRPSPRLTPILQIGVEMALLDEDYRLSAYAHVSFSLRF